MRKLLEEKLRRFEELEKQLVSLEVLASPARLSAVAREHGSLAKLAMKYRRFRNLNDQVAEALEMLDGPDRGLGGRAARRRPCSPATSTKCTNTTPKTGSGSRRSSAFIPPSWVGLRRSCWVWKAKASIASCSTKAAGTACSGCRKPRPRAEFTPRRPPWPSWPSRKTWKSS